MNDTYLIDGIHDRTRLSHWIMYGWLCFHVYRAQGAGFLLHSCIICVMFMHCIEKALVTYRQPAVKSTDKKQTALVEL